MTCCLGFKLSLNFYPHSLHQNAFSCLKLPRDVTYQDDGPQDESTEDVDVPPLVENENFPGLRRRRQR